MTNTAGEDRKTTLVALGRRGCECIGCKRLFRGVPAFDAHRTGPYNGDRRCMTDAEMTAAGLALDERGVWTWVAEIGKPRQRPPIRVAGPSRTPGTAEPDKRPEAAGSRKVA